MRVRMQMGTHGPTSKNKLNAAATATKDPRAPEKENMRDGLDSVLRLAVTPMPMLRLMQMRMLAASVKTGKMAAAAAAMTRAESVKPAPVLAATATAMSDHDHDPAAEAGCMGGAASRLLAAARGSSAPGPRRVPIDSTEAAAGVQARCVKRLALCRKLSFDHCVVRVISLISTVQHLFRLFMGRHIFIRISG